MDYVAEIKKLPREIADILISSFGAEVNIQIIDEFTLTDEQSVLFLDVITEVYLKQLEIQNIQEEISRRLRLNPKKSLELTTEICGKKLLIADDYFKGKVSDYLQSLGVNLTKYASIVAQELNAIEKEKESIEGEDDSSSFNDVLGGSAEDEEFVEQSKKDTLDLFKDDLGKILALDAEYNEIISEYNDDLEEYLSENDFARELEKIILNNDDIITRVKPIINEDTKEATISNWLKDFISFHGSDNFNTIVLAEYLVNSNSAKRLSVSDKKKIKRLLNIYRNVSFFNEVVTSNKGVIEVIPLENEVVEDSQIKNDIIDEKEEKSASVDVKEQEKEENIMPQESEPTITQEAVVEKESEKVEKPSILNELEIMLQDYSPDTLEYKTILQEIKRLKSNQK